jgi:RNA polymerase sigma-70 factor (ECF subfamily)
MTAASASDTFATVGEGRVLALSVASDDPLAELARAVIRGDRSATRTLLDALAPELLSVIRMVLGRDHPEAPDVLQNALLAVFRGLTTFRWESSVLHFARRVATKRALDVRRAAAARARAMDAMEQQSIEVDASSPVGADAERMRTEVRALLDTLPEEQAHAFAMRVVLGYTAEEIADAVSAPVGTVKSRLRLAKEALNRRVGGTRAPDERNQ